jgi:hypothetical protein
MRTVWKVVLPLALVLPMLAYVAGSLAASRSDGPTPRETVVIRDAPSTPSRDLPGSGREQREHRSHQDDDARGGTDDDHDDDVDDNGVRVVTPRPTPLDEQDDGDDDEDDEDEEGTEGDGDDDGGAGRDD